MPAVKWTAERNERLFLLVIKDVKLDYAKLAKDWKDRYGTTRRSNSRVRELTIL